ncbi:MAG: hypothetical protein NC548_15545 [Lachnospiraceae bacterium]|nr:hypothetical protein [Lachnospiraceae bacterium]
MDDEYILGPLEGRIFVQYKDQKITILRNTVDITDTFSTVSLNIIYRLFKEWRNSEDRLFSLYERKVSKNES